MAFEIIKLTYYICSNRVHLGRKVSAQAGEEDTETSFVFQRISVLIKRFNAVLLHDSFAKEQE